MENVERTHFVVLTGHLDDRPLPDLVRTLRVQRKSGRLQIEYPDAPGSFFFEDGQLVDAQLGNLRGLEALYAALELRGASFNFNPLVRPPERSIDRQGQKFVQDLIEAPRRENLSKIRFADSELQAQASIKPAPPPAPLQLGPAAAELMAPLEQRLTAVEAAIISTSRRFSRERLIYAVVISFLVGLTGVTALQALFGPFYAARNSTTDAASARAEEPKLSAADAGASNAVANAVAANTVVPAVVGAPRAAEASTARKIQDGVVTVSSERGVAASQPTGGRKRSEGASRQPGAATREARKASGGVSSAGAAGGYVVRVVMEVKDGRVTEARVMNPRAGAGAYEALALRTARQRRYPDKFTGGDTLKIKVKP